MSVVAMGTGWEEGWENSRICPLPWIFGEKMQTEKRRKLTT
jgi:hypothetical protein